MRNINNHILVLEAIEETRKELESRQESSLEAQEVLKRLVSLYACLDVTKLQKLLTDLKGLEDRKVVTLPREFKKKVA